MYIGGGVLLIILIVLFVIIMVGITNTFRIIMFERIKEIGTMRSMGMQRGEVRNLFLFEALFIALGGAIAGLALAPAMKIFFIMPPLYAIVFFFE